MSRTQSPRPGRTEVGATTTEEPAEAALLSLLDADYTEAILAAIRDEAKPARALAEACGASRPTVYRRLDSLEDAGLVDAEMAFDADGHHRTVYRATVDSVTVDLDDLSVTVTRQETERPPARGPLPEAAD